MSSEFKLVVWSFLFALALAVFVMWMSRRKEDRENTEREYLRQTGALKFITDALGLQETVEVGEAVRLTKGQMHANAAMRRRQEMIRQDERRTITGIVGGEEVIGWVQDGVVQLSVTRPSTRVLLNQALAFLVNRESELYGGLRLELDFMNGGTH